MVDFLWDNSSLILKGEETNIKKEAIDIIEDWSPGTWQSQIFIDSIFDQWKLQADPNYQRSLNRMATNRMRDYGVGHWWYPGETAQEVLEDF